MSRSKSGEEFFLWISCEDMVRSDVLHALQSEGRHEGRVGWKHRSSRLVFIDVCFLVVTIVVRCYVWH